MAFPSNEEETPPRTVANISRHVAGFDSVEIMIIDDGSSDRTIEVASEIGVDHIVRYICNRGLARTEMDLDHWTAITGQLSLDSDTQIDNNRAERAIKPFESPAKTGCSPRNRKGEWVNTG